MDSVHYNKMDGKGIKVSILLMLSMMQVFYHAVDGKCTGYRSPVTLSGLSGKLKSPMYPKSYPVNENCLFNLFSPFRHSSYLVVLEVTDIHLSTQRLGESHRKCTGHLKFFKEETDCQTTAPFCTVYYSNSNCEEKVRKEYSSCTAKRRRTLDPAPIQFISDQYYPQFTLQRGFLLNYEFVECVIESTKPPTTTTSTTREITTTAVTTTESTAAETTPVMTSSRTTTAMVPAVTTVEMTKSKTTAEITTTEIKAEITSPAISVTSPKILVTDQDLSMTSPNTTEQQEISTFATDGLDQSSLTTNIYDQRNTTIPRTSIVQGTTLLNNSGVDVKKGILEDGPTTDKQSGYPSWIFAPIVIGILVVCILIAILIVKLRKRKKQEDVSWLVNGFENPHFTELRTKQNDDDKMEEVTPIASPNRYEPAPIW